MTTNDGQVAELEAFIAARHVAQVLAGKRQLKPLIKCFSKD